MPWVKFSANFDWKVTPNALIAYKAGKSYLISQAAALAATARGAGEIVTVNGRPRGARPSDASR